MHSFFARHRKATIFRVMLLFSLFTVFSNCINPITPALFLELGFPDYMFGVGYAAMAGACFLLSPVWGKLCEKYGYTNILGGSFIGYALVQVVFSISTSQSVVILCRFMGGAAYSAGAVASLAYLIAVAPSGQNHRLMLYYSATTTVGCAAGYAIGGFIGTVSIQLMFRIQILVLLILGAVLFSILKDPEVSIKVQESVSKQSGQKRRRMKLFDPLFFLTVFLSNFAASGYDNAYNYYVKEALNFPNYYNGLDCQKIRFAAVPDPGAPAVWDHHLWGLPAKIPGGLCDRQFPLLCGECALSSFPTGHSLRQRRARGQRTSGGTVQLLPIRRKGFRRPVRRVHL